MKKKESFINKSGIIDEKNKHYKIPLKNVEILSSSTKKSIRMGGVNKILSGLKDERMITDKNSIVFSFPTIFYHADSDCIYYVGNFYDTIESNNKCVNSTTLGIHVNCSKLMYRDITYMIYLRIKDTRLFSVRITDKNFNNLRYWSYDGFVENCKYMPGEACVPTKKIETIQNMNDYIIVGFVEDTEEYNKKSKAKAYYKDKATTRMKLRFSTVAKLKKMFKL